VFSYAPYLHHCWFENSNLLSAEAHPGAGHSSSCNASFFIPALTDKRQITLPLASARRFLEELQLLINAFNLLV